jgi:hypothetical protein
VYCSHLHCHHELHTCLFGREHAFRAFPQDTNWPEDRGNCDGRQWSSIRVYHDGEETNCRDGHHCGMGIGSGDMTQCECVPDEETPEEQAAVNEPVTLNSTSTTVAGPYQVLEFSATTKECLSEGDTALVNIAYRSANNQIGTSLAFKFEYDPAFFALKSKNHSNNDQCQLSGFSEGSEAGVAFVSYICATYTGAAVVPASDAHIAQVELEALGTSDGLTSFSVVGNDDLASNGMSYRVGPPVHVRVGQCDAMLDTVGPLAIAATTN